MSPLMKTQVFLMRRRGGRVEYRKWRDLDPYPHIYLYCGDPEP